MKPWELKHTVYWYHTLACFARASGHERGWKAGKGRTGKNAGEDEGEAELEGVKESVNLPVASREKDEERNPERVHWQITHVICDGGVIKERLHEGENYLSLCARYWDKETLCNILAHTVLENKASHVMPWRWLFQKAANGFSHTTNTVSKLSGDLLPRSGLNHHLQEVTFN